MNYDIPNSFKSFRCITGRKNSVETNNASRFYSLGSREPVGMVVFELIAVGRVGEVVPGDEFFDQLVVPGNPEGAQRFAYGALDLAPFFPREENVDPLRFRPLLRIQPIDIVGNRRGVGLSG